MNQTSIVQWFWCWDEPVPSAELYVVAQNPVLVQLVGNLVRVINVYSRAKCFAQCELAVEPRLRVRWQVMS